MSITINLPSNNNLRIGMWLILAGLILTLDFFSGPFIQFPITYLIPISLATWYNGRRWGWALAVAMPLVRLYYSTVWVVPWTTTEASINALIRMTVFVSFVYLIDRVSQQKRAIEKEVKILEGLLPICGFCKKIRDEAGHWQSLERYITNHSEATFTHGFCPDCGKVHYPQYFKE